MNETDESISVVQDIHVFDDSNIVEDILQEIVNPVEHENGATTSDQTMIEVELKTKKKRLNLEERNLVSSNKHPLIPKMC